MTEVPDVPDVCAQCGAELDESSEGLCAGCVLERALDPASGPDEFGPGSGDAPGRVGDYELLGEVGRGATGVVFKARQISLDRLVAVKLLRDGPWADPEAIKRFRREVRASAALRHPRIIRVYEVAEADGQLYYSMDFIDGPNLNALVEGEPVAPRRAAEIVRDLAEAVGHMHERGIVHRDLKPSNVLLDESGPLITDFGLSTSLDTGAPLTVTGAVLGTPGYLPPEQIGAKLAHLNPTSDPRADIYSLGAMLYALLTGGPPFRGASPFETLMEHLRSEVTPPRRLRRALPRDLETICLKCLERDPEKRYGSASDLAEDLKRFLTHRPVRARSLGPFGRAWRWTRRHPMLCGSLVALGLVVGLLWLVAGWTSDRLKQSRSETRQVQTIAHMERGDVEGALALLTEEVEEMGPTAASRRLAFELLSPPRFQLRRSIDLEVPRCAFDDETGRMAVGGRRNGSGILEVYDMDSGEVVDRSVAELGSRWTASEVALDGGEGGPLSVWNPRLGRIVQLERPEADFRALAWLTGRSYMIAVSDSQDMWKWDLETKRLEKMPMPGYPQALDGDRLVFRYRGAIHEFDLRTGRQSTPIARGGLIEVSRDGGTALQYVSSQQAAVWNLPERSIVGYIPLAQEDRRKIRLSPDGRRLVAAGGESQQTLRVWNLEATEAGPRHLLWRGSGDAHIQWAEFSADGRFLAVAGVADGSGSVWVWNVDTGQEIARLEHQYAPKWSASGLRLCTRRLEPDPFDRRESDHWLSGSVGSGIHVWDVESLAPVFRVEPTSRRPRILRQGHRLIAGRTIWEFDSNEPVTLRRVRRLELGRDEIASLDSRGRPWAVRMPREIGKASFPVGLVRLGPDRDRAPLDLEPLPLPSPSSDEEPASESTLWPFGQHVLFSHRENRVWATGAVVEHDSKQNLNSPWGSMIASWTLADGHLSGPVFLERREVEAKDWVESSDGRTLAVSGQIAHEFGLGIWDVESARWTAELPHSLFPSDVGFTPDGENVVTVGPESQIEITRISTKEMRSWLGDDESLSALAIDSRGEILATAGSAPEITLWDLATGQVLVRWTAHVHGIRDLAFHPERRWLVSLSADGLLRVWDLEALYNELRPLGLEWRASFDWNHAGSQGDPP